jgi:hypothetical protein
MNLKTEQKAKEKTGNAVGMKFMRTAKYTWMHCDVNENTTVLN